MSKRISERSYSLRRYERSSDPGFAEALALYARNTHPEVRADSREICYWLDRFAERAPDRFYCLGFFIDRLQVGYAQFVYLNDLHMVFFDYLVVDRDHRRNSTFFELVDHVRRFIEQEQLEVRVTVAEVGFTSGSDQPTRECVLIARLLHECGFRTVEVPYVQPQLGARHPETESRAVLMLYSFSDNQAVRTDLLLSIVRAVYFDHYSAWYEPLVPDPAAYKRRVQALLDDLQHRIGNAVDVRLNGVEGLDRVHPPYPVGSQPIASKSRRSLVLYLTGVVASAIATVIASRLSDGTAAVAATTLITLSCALGLLLCIKREFRLTARAATLAFLAIALVYLCVLAVYVPTARGALRSFVSALKAAFGK